MPSAVHDTWTAGCPRDVIDLADDIGLYRNLPTTIPAETHPGSDRRRPPAATSTVPGRLQEHGRRLQTRPALTAWPGSGEDLADDGMSKPR